MPRGCASTIWMFRRVKSTTSSQFVFIVISGSTGTISSFFVSGRSHSTFHWTWCSLLFCISSCTSLLGSWGWSKDDPIPLQLPTSWCPLLPIASPWPYPEQMPHYPLQRCWWRDGWGWFEKVDRGDLFIPFYRIWCWWIFLILYWFFFLFYWCLTKIFTSLFPNCIFSTLNLRFIPWGWPLSCWVLPPRGLVFGFRLWYFMG